MTAADYGLWRNLRADPVAPIAEPKPRARPGDWLDELGVKGWPPAPEGWALRQMLSHDGSALALVYLHRTTARGVSVVLAHKPDANGPGKAAWRFVKPGFIWRMCTDLDCDTDRLHTEDLPKATGAKDLKALLTEGTN